MVVLGLAILLLLLVQSESNSPRFNKSPSLTFPSNATVHFLNFLTSRPFEGGKMCLGVSFSQTNWQLLIFDIEKRRVLGEVTNGWPVMLFGDPSKLLCYQITTTPWRKHITRQIFSMLARLFKRRSGSSLFIETQIYWVLELEKNTAKRLGEIPGSPNFTEVASPDFAYCFTGRLRPDGLFDYYLLELRHGSIRKFETTHRVCGWWDNSRILLESTNLDLSLYDVRSKATSPLISSGTLRGFLERNKLAPGTPRPFFVWNGRENDVYLTDLHQKWLAAESFLIKLERPDGRLKLLSPSFKFEWSDHLDASGQLYLYSGREQGQGSDGVFLRHLDANTNQILVASSTNRDHSIPRFYGNSVIYMRSNAVWRIGLDGSNNVKLFPADVPH